MVKLLPAIAQTTLDADPRRVVAALHAAMINIDTGSYAHAREQRRLSYRRAVQRFSEAVTQVCRRITE